MTNTEQLNRRLHEAYERLGNSVEQTRKLELEKAAIVQRLADTVHDQIKVESEVRQLEDQVKGMYGVPPGLPNRNS